MGNSTAIISSTLLMENHPT